MAYFVPLGKLLVVGLKLVSKPVATVIKGQAKTHPMLQDACARFGEGVHKFVVRIFRLARDESASGLIKELPRDKAIDRGADLIGDLFVLFVVGGVTTYEVVGSRREKAEVQLEKERKRKERDMQRQAEANEIHHRIDALEHVLRVLEDRVNSMHDALQSVSDKKGIIRNVSTRTE